MRHTDKVASSVPNRFQFTHPHGVRHCIFLVIPDLTYNFNPRTHTGCDRSCKPICTGIAYFNPRTHTGCDVNSVMTDFIGKIISIHAPTQGATSLVSDIVILQVHFNPRTHTGCDLVTGKRREKADSISIHAPTQGATGALGTIDRGVKISIHAPTQGATC